MNSPRLKSYLSPIQFHSLLYKVSRSYRSIQKEKDRVLQKYDLPFRHIFLGLYTKVSSSFIAFFSLMQ